MRARGAHRLRGAWLVGALLGACVAPGEAGEAAPDPARRGGSTAAAARGDWESPDTLAAAVYSIVSGPAGEERDWDRYRALFVEGARLASIDTTQPDRARFVAFGVDDYVGFYEPSFFERGIFEREVWSRTDGHGSFAQRFGTCEFRWDDPGGPPDGRCLVGMRFFHDGQRWWITSMTWESFSDPAAVPARYLPPVAGAAPAER